MAKTTYDVCIVGGLGHVGLPLGISLAYQGKRVIVYDTNENAIERVSSGKMPFMEEGAEEILAKVINKTFFLSSDRRVIESSYFVIIVIGTPVDEHLNPEFTLLREPFSEIFDIVTDHHHVILRSTVFPGTTEKVRALLRAKGKKTKISFCPERIAEGKAMEELRSLPQIVAAFDAKSRGEAKELFSLLTKDIVFLDPMEAELAKLFTNVWRYIQFSIANQFFEIATQNDLDFYKIYKAITFNYGRAKDFPGAGFAAGPCLFKDTMQLAAFSENSFFLGHAAMLINEGLPGFIVQQLKKRHPLKKKVIGILGMAFKGNSDDPRESLSYKLKKLLEIESKQVICTDPYVNDKRLLPLEEVLEKSDILVLGAPHSTYGSLKKRLISKPLVDIWNFFGKGGFCL